MKCLNVIVYYDNFQEVKDYIQSVCTISYNMVDMIIVVNSNKKNMLKELEKFIKDNGFNSCWIYNYNTNVGYLNSLLKTIKHIELQKYDYYILSNTDILYNSKDFFIKLKNKQYRQNIGCIAPSVYSTSLGVYSNPHYISRLTAEGLKFRSIIFSNRVLSRAYFNLSRLKSKKKKALKQESCEVYSPHGSYMIFTLEFIKKIAGYEYGVKMYSEESCIGELLLRANMKCWYDADIEVSHVESTVTRNMSSKAKCKAFHDSLRYILDEFY